MGGRNRSLLIINKSSEAHLKLKLYVSCDPVCFMPHTSKEIKPNGKLFYTSEWGCKLELAAVLKDPKQPKKVLLKPQQWVGKKYVRITESLDVIEDDLSNYPEEEKEGLRKINRDKELGLTSDGRRNFYHILRLDMDEVRKMSQNNQDKEIARAFLSELQIWHPDHNEDGDVAMVRELIMAYSILKDREKRARYNNLTDYDKGWLSGKRFKAVFWPECETVAQRLAWMKRMGLLALSAGLTIGVVVTIVLTAGLSSPWSQCAVKGGFDSLRESISKEAVLDGRDVQKHLISTGAGYLLAFLPGGAAIGASLVQSAALSASEFLGIRIAIATGCATVKSLRIDAKSFMDVGKITAKQAFCHAACHCTAAVAAILTEHAIPKDMRLGTAAETNSNLEIAAEEIGEQGLTDQAKSSLLERIPNFTKVITEKAGQLLTAEKHSDDTEADLPEAEIFSLPDDVVLETAFELKALAEKSLQHDNLEDLSFEEGNVDGSECTQDDAEVHLTDEQSNNGAIVMYLCNGWWYSGLSKMIMSYLLTNEELTKKVRGNGKQVKIPYNAREMKVRFKIWRPTSGWGDVFKYDRLKRCWCEPYEPHVFHYPTPVTRTFTIEGTLWWEAVMKVTDKHHNEKDDM